MGGDSLPAGQWGWVGTVTSTPAKLPKSSVPPPSPGTAPPVFISLGFWAQVLVLCPLTKVWQSEV